MLKQRVGVLQQRARERESRERQWLKGPFDSISYCGSIKNKKKNKAKRSENNTETPLRRSGVRAKKNKKYKAKKS